MHSLITYISLTKINRKVTIVREITKIYEEVLQGSAEEILKIITVEPLKTRASI
jgi:16S rRNA C1402 (ribose-2'-O) methylase RsmI